MPKTRVSVRTLPVPTSCLILGSYTDRSANAQTDRPSDIAILDIAKRGRERLQPFPRQHLESGIVRPDASGSRLRQVFDEPGDCRRSRMPVAGAILWPNKTAISNPP